MAAYARPQQQPGYRQSYVEKDRCVRNSTQVQVPGVDVMQGFKMSKSQFEQVFLQTADNFDQGSDLSAAPSDARAQRPPRNGGATPNRFTRAQRKHSAQNIKAAAAPHGTTQEDPIRKLRETTPSSQRVNGAASPRNRGEKQFRQPAQKDDDRAPLDPAEAESRADDCRRSAASLQRSIPSDYEAAGELFERAVDIRAKNGLFCTSENADAHVEYAQNLSKRGLTPEAEYHLRSAADIFRILSATAARKYGDVLLYMAVVIDRQGRLAEAENFYRSALAVYRANKLSDDNVRVAIDSLSNNLRAQGRPEEVDGVVRRHFLGALD